VTVTTIIDIRRAFDDARSHEGSPTCIIAKTIKGKGFSFMEGDYNWHAKVPTDADLAKALGEIGARREARVLA
jgi:transketolase